MVVTQTLQQLTGISWLMSIQNNMEQVIFTKAGNGRFTFITPNAANLLGFSVSDILNKTEIELFGPELGFESLEVDQRVSLTGASVSFDAQLSVGSQPRKLHIIKHPYLTESGDVSGIIGTIQEVVDETCRTARITTGGRNRKRASYRKRAS